MDNQDFNMEELQALIAGIYSGGNSWAARSARARLQRRDDEGKFAEMFGSMRLVMLLNGVPVAAYGTYVGASTRKGPDGSDNMGWNYISPDKNFPNGRFIRTPMDKVNMFDGEDGGVAILPENYLAEKGIDPKNPSFSAGMLNYDDLESQDYPPGFLPEPNGGEGFISEDGDISIIPNEYGGWDVIDNVDESTTTAQVDNLVEALKAVQKIDESRSNYNPEGGAKPSTPVAEIPDVPTQKSPPAAGLTNKELLDEYSKFYDSRGLPTGREITHPERRDEITDEVDQRASLEPEGYEGEDWFVDNPDFVRDPSQSEAPVAELPTDTTSTPDAVEQAEADVENSEQVAEETADPATVDAAEKVVAEETPVVEQAPIKPPRAPREPSIGAFTGRMLELLNGITDPKQVQDIINGEEITYIDFETSGFSAVPGDGALNRPLQMGIVKVKNGEVVDRKNIWMNPEMQLSEWSRNNLVDGDGNPLTDEWLANQQSMKDALTEAVAFIGPNAILGGQNVQFDLEVLNRSLREQGIDFSFDGTIDSRDLGKKTLPTWSPESPVGPTKTDADGNKSASNSLGDLIAFLKEDGYDVTLDNWHSADADAQATHELVQALLQRAVDNNVDMGVLTDKQQRDAESASEWATYANEYDTYVADLSKYFDQTQDPNKDARLALAQPLTPDSFGIGGATPEAGGEGGDKNPPTPPVAPSAEEPDSNKRSTESYPARAKQLLENIAAMRDNIREQLSVAEANKDAKSLARLVQRFDMLQVTEDYIHTRVAENADTDIAPDREYILNNLRVIDIARNSRTGRVKDFTAFYTAPNGISYRITKIGGGVYAYVDNFGDMELTDQLGQYLPTAGTDYQHHAAHVSLTEDGDSVAPSILAEFDIPMSGTQQGSGFLVTPGMIELEDDMFKTVGSALHIVAQSIAESDGDVYRHSSYLLAPGMRAALRLNGADPNMLPFALRERALSDMGAPTATFLESLGLNVWFSRPNDYHMSLGDYNWGGFDKLINQPLNVYGRHLWEQFHDNPDAVAGMDYPAYFGEYVQQNDIENFEPYSLLNKFIELNYEGRDVEGFITTIDTLRADLDKFLGRFDTSLDIQSGSESGDDYVEINLSPAITIDLLEQISDALKNGDLGDNTIERTVLQGNTVIPVDPSVSAEETINQIDESPELSMTVVNDRNSFEKIILNSAPTTADIRVARLLDGVSDKDIKVALETAIAQESQKVSIGDQNKIPVQVLSYALSLRGVDADMIIAKALDKKSDSSKNVDALKEYRQTHADIIKQGRGDIGEVSDENKKKIRNRDEAIDDFIFKNSGPAADLYRMALENGQEDVGIYVENFMGRKYGGTDISIPISEFRDFLERRGIDVEAIDNQHEEALRAQEELAKALDSTVEDLTPVYRTDWKDAISSGSNEYSDIRFYDEDGKQVHFYRDSADGKWYNSDPRKTKGKRSNKGLDNDQMIRLLERDTDKDEQIEITDGNGHDSDGNLLDETKNAFSFGNGKDDESISEADAATINSWRHITYGDLKALRALQNQGEVVDIMEKLQEIFPDAERRGDDELVTETHTYGDYKYEVVATSTPNGYYYMYLRQINTKTGKAVSMRPGRMNQSALGFMRTYRREVSKFHRSFFQKGGPSRRFLASQTGAGRFRKKNDVFDQQAGHWIHSKDVQLDRNTSASILSLLGSTPESVQAITKAEDHVMRDILETLGRVRHDDNALVKAAASLFEKHKNKEHPFLITPEYLRQVSDAYDQHMLNQQNLENNGDWISFDQRTPIDKGDLVKWHFSLDPANEREGIVRTRLGFVDARGGYRYTDYVLVQWDDGTQQVTTSRNLRIIMTEDGTDGSERTQYKPEFQDPRADYGTEVGDPRGLHLPNPIVVPKPVNKPEPQTVSRNDNSELVMEDGTVIPEHLVGTTPAGVFKHPSEITRGDVISLLNDEKEPVQATAIKDAEINGDYYSVDVAVRQSDGTYTVQKLFYNNAPENRTQIAQYPSVNEANGVTPGQMNEIMELLGSKVLPSMSDSGVMDFYLGVLSGKDMSGTYSAEEISDIIQELRSLPDRDTNKDQDAADLARALAEGAERDGDTDTSQTLEQLADGADIVASQGAGEETPSVESPEAGPTPTSETSPLKDRIASEASAIGLGANSGNSLPENTNANDVQIEGDSSRKGTEPTDEARDAKNKMLSLGAQVWDSTKQRVADILNGKGRSLKDYSEIETYATSLLEVADNARDELKRKLGVAGTLDAFGLSEDEKKAVMDKMIADGYADSDGFIDVAKIKKDLKPDIDFLYEYTLSDGRLAVARTGYMGVGIDGYVYGYYVTTNPEGKRKHKEYLDSVSALASESEKAKTDKKDFQIELVRAHDQATIDELKDLGVEFDSVTPSEFGLVSMTANKKVRANDLFGLSALSQRSMMYKGLEEAFQRIPKSILTRVRDEIKSRNVVFGIGDRTVDRGAMSHFEYGGTEYFRIISSATREDSTSYDSKHADTMLHEFWHVIQKIIPDVGQIEHAWTYDRIVSKDSSGNDILPPVGLAIQNGDDDEVGFQAVSGISDPYILKQYQQEGKGFFDPNNQASEVSTMIMQDIFGSHGTASLGTGMTVVAKNSDNPNDVKVYSASKLFFDEATGTWYSDKEMTKPLDVVRTIGRPKTSVDEDVKHLGLGMLLALTDWSPTTGLSSTPQRKTYRAEDLYYDESTGNWYTDSSMTVKVDSADVRGNKTGA